MADNNEFYESVTQSTESLREFSEGLSGASGNFTKLGAITKDYIDLQAKRKEAEYKVVRGLQEFGSILVDLKKSATDVEGGFSTFNSQLRSVGDGALRLGAQFGTVWLAAGLLAKGFTVLLEASFKQADATIKAQSEIAKLGGANTIFGKQILDMGHKVGLASYDLEKLTRPLKNVQGGLAGLGKTQEESIKKSVEMLATDEQARSQLRRLGYQDREEQNEAILGFIEYLNQAGGTFNSILGTPQEAALEYTKSLQELSEFTGKSVQEEKKKMEAANATLQAAAYRNDLERKIRNTTDTAEKERLQKQLKAFDVFNKNMEKAGVTGERLAFAQRQYTTGVSEQGIAISGLGAEIDKYKRSVDRNADDMNAAGDRLAKGSIEAQDSFAGRMGRTVINFSDTIQKALGGAEGLAANTTAMNRSIQKSTMAENDRLNALNDANREMKKTISVFFDEIIQSMSPFFELFNPTAPAGFILAIGGVSTALYFFGGKIKDVILGMLNPFNRLNMGLTSLNASINELIVAMKTGGAAGALGDKTSVADTIGGKKGPTAGAKIANIGKGLGKGLGGLTQGLLTGVAAGLKAFDNPMVVAGAAALAASITLIGAGIAGASWIMGKAMPTLAEGLKAFGEIDGENLKKVGLGMIGLATGLMAFGPGSVMASVGNVIGGLFDKLGSLFENDSPVEKFTKLVKDVDASKAEKVGKAFKEFGEGISSFPSGSNLRNFNSTLKTYQNFVKNTDVDKAMKLATALGQTVASSKGTSGGARGGITSGGAASGAASDATGGGGGGGALGGASTGTSGKTVSPTKNNPIAQIQEIGSGFNVVKRPDGRTEKQIGRRNWRNNNPGNLEFGSFAKQYGALGADPRFAIFPSLDAGRNAQAALLFDSKKYKDLMIDQAIAKYAPPSENDTGTYIQRVLGAVGGQRKRMSQYGSGERSAILDVMARHEGFKEGKVISAATGGIFDGPSSGYPATLHGREIVAPLNADTMLGKLAKTPASEPTIKTMDNSMDRYMNMNASIMQTVASKLDRVIDHLEKGNDTSRKLLQYTRV